MTYLNNKKKILPRNCTSDAPFLFLQYNSNRCQLLLYWFGIDLYHLLQRSFAVLCVKNFHKQSHKQKFPCLPRQGFP